MTYRPLRKTVIFHYTKPLITGNLQRNISLHYNFLLLSLFQVFFRNFFHNAI